MRLGQAYVKRLSKLYRFKCIFSIVFIDLKDTTLIMLVFYFSNYWYTSVGLLAVLNCRKCWLFCIDIFFSYLGFFSKFISMIGYLEIILITTTTKYSHISFLFNSLHVIFFLNLLYLSWCDLFQVHWFFRGTEVTWDFINRPLNKNFKIL